MSKEMRESIDRFKSVLLKDSVNNSNSFNFDYLHIYYKTI